MVDNYPDIRDAIRAEVQKAANRRQSLHTGRMARNLIAKYPDCGMTLRGIEDVIVQEVGQAGGAAELEHTTEKQQVG